MSTMIGALVYTSPPPHSYACGSSISVFLSSNDPKSLESDQNLPCFICRDLLVNWSFSWCCQAGTCCGCHIHFQIYSSLMNLQSWFTAKVTLSQAQLGVCGTDLQYYTEYNAAWDGLKPVLSIETAGSAGMLAVLGLRQLELTQAFDFLHCRTGCEHDRQYWKCTSKDKGRNSKPTVVHKLSEVLNGERYSLHKGN